MRAIVMYGNGDVCIKIVSNIPGGHITKYLIFGRR
jgi:hypothetical protein